MGESSGSGQGGSPGGARRVGGVATFDNASAEESLGRRQAQGSTFASMAFADVEKENEVCCNSQVCMLVEWHECTHALIMMHKDV